MEPISDEDFAEFIKILQNMDGPTEAPDKKDETIDKKMKDLEDTVVAMGMANAVVVCVFILVLMLILRSCGG
jgi:hypothetical protein